MQRTTVMLLFGGESSEHTVSVSSARNVFAALDDAKYDVVLGYIDQEGKWWLLNNLSDQIDIVGALQLLPILGTGKFKVFPSDEIITPAVILPILHGANGEDGTVQGLAQLLHIPIVGCKVAASAIAMDKIFTKQLLEHNNIKTVPYRVNLSDEALPNFDQLSTQLGSPLFVKPANGGSSVGISKVKNEEELNTALIEAHRHDSKVLIEQAITARELEVGVLGSGTKARVSGVGEICPDREFYNFESKYDVNSQTKAIIPADIPAEMSKEIRKIAAHVYAVLGCEGLARIDFFLSDHDDLYLNEINTLPGFTNISMYPKLWRQEGLAYSELVDSLINDTLEK
ncbi:MAG TPA: D-alanine--D-alanine ligase family protein [Candidatus Angelobacter sp.]|nr:D-alanine--D-alanine ligase family protein [Candidatus Angelobacter sp.]